MTFEEKEKLSKQMESLPEDKLIHVIQIMRKRHPEIGEDNEEVEVDIESIDNETLWELERFISNYVKSKEKKSKMIPRRNQEASQV
jgi:predicted transposase YdaD